MNRPHIKSARQDRREAGFRWHLWELLSQLAWFGG